VLSSLPWAIPGGFPRPRAHARGLHFHSQLNSLLCEFLLLPFSNSSPLP
jgi:hypothetical protein